MGCQLPALMALPAISLRTLHRMGDFKKLKVWQKAHALAVATNSVTGKTRGPAHSSLRSQMNRAAMSIDANTVEGSGQKSDKEFARFVRIGRRSLNEVQDCFRSALLKQHVVVSDLVQARRLMRRLYPAISSFLATLDP